MKYIISSFICFSFLVQGQTIDPLKVDLSNQYAQKKWVDSVYKSLSLNEKVGQLFMPMVFSEKDSLHYFQTLKLVKEQKVGGLIFSRGGPIEQSHWLNDFQAHSKTPLLIAMDAEWGVAMRLDSVKPFPWSMTLGAVNDSLLLRKIGQRMAEQEKRLGIHYSFGPVLDINTNPNNPIIGNRSFGASKERVSRQALAIMRGHHDFGILTSGKHFPGHGDTALDSHKTLPTIELSSKRIKSIELEPYNRLIDAGLSSVMVAHLSVPSLTRKGLPTSLSKDIIQKILIDEIGFKGLIVTDALNMKGVSEYYKVKNIDLAAFKAGNDLLLISNDIPEGIRAITEAIEREEITEARLANSVKKILKAKYKVGLSNYKPVIIENLIQDLNTPFDDALHAEAIGKALTLLKNNNSLLPLKKVKNLGHLPLGDASSSSFQSQLSKYQKTTTLYGVTQSNALEKARNIDTLIISFHRSNDSPWKAGSFNNNEIKIINKLALTKTIILDLFVNPYSLKSVKNIKGIDALLLSYQNSSISQELSVDALFGSQDIKGELPVDISDFFSEGSGIELKGNFRLGFSSPAKVGMNNKKLIEVDKLALQTIDSMMTPGMQVLAARNGKIFYQKNFGFHTYKKEQKVKSTDLYDLASLTKILGTLPLVMKSINEGSISLETTVAELLPDWSDTNKAKLTLREMLSHYARLVPWIPFYKETLNDKGFPKKTKYRSEFSPKFSIEVAKDLFLKTDFEKEIYDQIRTSELVDSLSYLYSDLPYYILKKYFESSFNKSYDKLVSEKVFNPLGLKEITYSPLNKFDTTKIVPSEIDDYFRNQKLDGYVHDMGAAMQNGIGAHAGLFGNSEAVASIMQMYLQGGAYNGIQLLDSKTIASFNSCSYCSLGNRRGVGFDKPQLEGVHISTCGCVSEKSFGHSGYTGTYAWADPEKQIVIVILTNRTYPDDDFAFSKNNIRTRLQELFYNAIIN
ncbi:serine hydrolase [Flavobacteriaceae bacterium]|nr:serine hydrolase [Flavobacteriaceae bacterium]